MDRDARQETTTLAAANPHSSVAASAPPSGASLLEEGRNCYRVVRAPRAALLVDAADYFEAFMRAAERATRSIIIVGWDFDTRTRLLCGDSRPGIPDTLGEF